VDAYLLAGFAAERGGDVFAVVEFAAGSLVKSPVELNVSGSRATCTAKSGLAGGSAG
jgi:hypothetical protein